MPEYYLKAISMAERNGLKDAQALMLTNLGFSLFRNDSLRSAKSYMEQGILLLEKTSQHLEYAKGNLALTKFAMANGEQRKSSTISFARTRREK